MTLAAGLADYNLAEIMHTPAFGMTTFTIPGLNYQRTVHSRRVDYRIQHRPQGQGLLW
jgi:hypothetical protein